MRKGILCSMVNILGSLTDNAEVWSTYKKAKKEDLAERVNPLTAEEEDKKVEEMLKDMEENGVKGSTIFCKDETGIYLRDYQILGFLKAAGIFNKKQFGEDDSDSGKKGKKWGAIDSKIRQFIKVDPVRIYLMWNNEEFIKASTGWLERPLRCETAQGPRVALAKSELIEADDKRVITFKFIIDVPDKAPISWNMLTDMLDYGDRVGMLQWRTAGYGRFKWREIPESSIVLPTPRDMFATVKGL